MNHPKFLVSYQVEEPIRIQRVELHANGTYRDQIAWLRGLYNTTADNSQRTSRQCLSKCKCGFELVGPELLASTFKSLYMDVTQDPI